MISSLRGTCDILPEDIKYWHFIENKARVLFHNASYSEIRTPLIENQELFKRGVGQGTDIVNKEMYCFQDQGQRNIVLRPEGTAGIARSFIQHKLHSSKGIHKVWYAGPMFRYERPQSGRQRQFNQLGIECLGVKDPRVDAEVISIAYNFLSALNIGEFKLEINSIGNSLARQKYSESLKTYLLNYEADLDKDSLERLSINPLRILDSKFQKTQKILNGAPNLFDFIDISSKKHFEILCSFLNALKIPYEINHRLVRGLDYYSDTAFEFKTNLLGGQDTICGGGRYDDLIKNLGGPSTPAIGWAIGIERLLILIKKNHVINNDSLDVYIICDNFLRCKIEAAVLFDRLINVFNIKVEIDETESTIRKKIKRAYKSGAQYCIIVGENEVASDEVTIKNLVNNREKQIKIKEILNNSADQIFH